MTRSIPLDDTTKSDAALQARPWLVLESIDEFEAWIDRLNQELQQIGGAASDRGQGVCLTLTHGGRITMHTNSDGDILLDVDSDGEWVSPLIMAATGAQEPRGSIWNIPGERLIELMMGLNHLIVSENLVLQHHFRARK